MVSPALAARQTAETLGLEVSVVHSLRDVDHGEWTGQGFEAIQQRDPLSLAGWLADPTKGVPGGESLSDVVARLAPWLQAQAERDAHLLAITHPMIIRAALIAALDFSPTTTMRIDIKPLGAVRLSFNRIWRLQSLNAD